MIDFSSTRNVFFYPESIVGDLASNDKNAADNAMKRADLYLHDATKHKNIDVECCELQEKTNRTVINQAAFDEMGKPESDEATMSQGLWTMVFCFCKLL